MTDLFAALMAPRSVALVGASEDATRIGGRPLRYMREAGFKGRVFPVNPRRQSVQGLEAFASINDLPEVPDTAILALPASATLQAVEECAARGLPSAVIFSAGFAETGADGQALQARILATARAGGVRLLGPNCLGVLNPAIGYYGTFSVILDDDLIVPGPVGIVSQSGAYGAHLAHLARARGLGVSQWVTTGNEADIDLSEALEWMARQPETKVIMAYAEGVRDRDSFIRALECARDHGKPVVFMKTGRSSVGAAAAVSHTAALAGSDVVFDAVLRQYGVHRATTTTEQIDVAYVCASGRYPASDRIGIFTMSGGFGIQLADDAGGAGLDVAPMPDAAQDELLRMLPYASPRNPVDATAQAVSNMEMLTRCVQTMMKSGSYALFAGILGTGPVSRTFAAPLRRALLAGFDPSDTTIRALTMSAPQEVVRRYEADGFLVFQDGSALAHALGALCRLRDALDRAAPPVAPMAPLALPAGPVSEAGAKAILSRAGVTFAAEHLAADPDSAASAATEIGFPVVAKICSPDILHKTEIGGVAINLTDAQAVRAAATAILARARDAAPNARIEGVLVAPMVTGGVETIIGVTRDPALGPVVMFGLGGIHVEVLKDVTFRAAPFPVEEAHRMIREIRGFAILQGVRGAPPADIDALAQLLSDLSRFAIAHRETVRSIDLNPVRVMAQGNGVVALDALIELEEVLP